MAALGLWHAVRWRLALGLEIGSGAGSGADFIRRGDMGSTPPQGSSEGGLKGDGVHAGHETKVEDMPDGKARRVSG